MNKHPATLLLRALLILIAAATPLLQARADDRDTRVPIEDFERTPEYIPDGVSPPPNDYANYNHERIKSAEVVGALGDDLFGEQVNMYTGSIEFSHTDLDIPGNNSLPVRVARRFKVDYQKVDQTGNAFGDWEIDVPYMSGKYTRQFGWLVQTSAPTSRCSSPQTLEQAAPPGFHTPPPNYAYWHSYQIWEGNDLYVPGKGEPERAAKELPNSS